MLTAPDTTAPTASFSPIDEATGVAVSANIILTFSEDIVRGVGNIVLKTVSGIALATYDAATSANLSITGNVLTINPTADLGYSTAYSVEFSAGSIKDVAGNNYAGTTSYNFTTAGPPSTYSLVASTAIVNEGGAVTFTVATTNVAANTVLNYTLSGTGITTADIGGALLTGTTTVAANGVARFTVNLAADQLAEGAETLTATVQGQSASVTVYDIFVTPVVAGRTKYFVLPSPTGANFTDFDLSCGSGNRAGEQVTFVGSSGVDAVFVRPGVTVDFTLSGSGADKIYLGGSFSSYTASISGSVMKLEHGSGSALESVSFIKAASAASSDSVIFADGSLSSLDLYNNLKTGAALPALSTTETSISPLAPAAVGSTLNASIKAFALNVAGDTFAPAHPGMAMTVIGNLGVDTVYVPHGGVVDCTLLGSGQDLVYFGGNWGDYTKAISGSVLTFSRTVDGYSESVRVVGSGTASLNDQLVFADGAVHSTDAKMALTASLLAGISSVSGYDAMMKTLLGASVSPVIGA